MLYCKIYNWQTSEVSSILFYWHF